MGTSPLEKRGEVSYIPFTSTPRNLQRLSHQEEHQLIKMELTEARKLEELMQSQCFERWRYHHHTLTQV